MVETIQGSLHYLSNEDLLSIARYLKMLPPGDDPARYQPERRNAAERTEAEGNRTPDVESIGAATYKGFCASCHGADGAGIPHVYPKLAGNPSVMTKDTTSLIRLVIQDGTSPATRTGPPPQAMPRFGSILSDLPIANVLDYLRTSWGNQADPVSTNNIRTVRKNLEQE